MHIYFSGVGGAGMAPLAQIAHAAGYKISGSDKQAGSYLTYLQAKGLPNLATSAGDDHIRSVHSKLPIDWIVYSSALPKENPNHPVLEFAKQAGIKCTKRDEFINHFLTEKHLKLVAVSGTHGKTTTTAMIVWLFKQLGLPVSYSVGSKLSFGEPGEYDQTSEYFVYECDEYDRNFLAFKPEMAVITGIDWDHPDVFPTREDYYRAFVDFHKQSKNVLAHPDDLEKIGIAGKPETIALGQLKLPGEVNRKNAQLAVEAVRQITQKPVTELLDVMNKFPGLSRRFEPIATNIFTDYAHTPEKIRGALQMAHELAGDNVVIIYEGLHNTRQHFIKDELAHLFDSVKKLYVVPSYRAREDESLEDLTPEKLVGLTSQPEKAEATELNDDLLQKIKQHAVEGDLVLALSAGGGNSLDEWLRDQFKR